MKVIRFHQHGGPEVLKYEDIPEPVLEYQEVLLDVKACSVNHLDIWIRKGLPGIKTSLPHIPGSDAAGIVKDVAAGVTSISKGDRVVVNPSLNCGRCEFCVEGNASLCISYSIFGEHQDGTYAQLIKVPATNVIKIPDHVSFEEVAAVPLVYMTAWRMLITKAKIRPGDDILIQSAGAGVGIACIQIAKLNSCRIFATTSSDEKCRKLKELGCDFVFNYTKDDVVKKVREITNKRGVDVVVDYTGKATWQSSLQSLKRGGKLVTCGATSGYDPQEDIRHIFFRQLEIHGSTMGSSKELMEPLKLFFTGKIKPVIDQILPLKEAQLAHRLIEDRKVFGKLVLKVE